MKQNALNPQSVTADMFKAREVTPIVRGFPSCEDSQPIPWIRSVKAVQLADRGAPNLTTALGGLISTGQGEPSCFPANPEYELTSTDQADKKMCSLYI